MKEFIKDLDVLIQALTKASKDNKKVAPIRKVPGTRRAYHQYRNMNLR